MAISPKTMEWFQGLAAVGCTFIELIPNEKRPKRSLDHFKPHVGQIGVSRAVEWLTRGSGVGIVPKCPVWILDADSPAQVNRIVDIFADLGIEPLMVSTPRGGGHFYCRLPADFPTEKLKTYLPAPNDKRGQPVPLDFKFPGTLLVAPGTVRNGNAYAPASSWRPPPVLDPREILPDGKFWKEPQRPFLVNPRPLKDRLAAARIYLSRDAPVSISGKHGTRTLNGVASHLVVFLGLDPVTAASLMLHGETPWNHRCADQDGNPYPWTQDELWTACKAAVGTVPAAGEKLYFREQARLEQKNKLAELVANLKAALTKPAKDRVAVAKVLDDFDWLGLPDLTDIALGDELVAQGIPRVMATGKRTIHIPGLDYSAMLGMILEAKRTRQMQNWGPCVAILESIRAHPSPPPSTGRDPNKASWLTREPTV